MKKKKKNQHFSNNYKIMLKKKINSGVFLSINQVWWSEINKRLKMFMKFLMINLVKEGLVQFSNVNTKSQV